MLQVVLGCWQEVLENTWLTGESGGGCLLTMGPPHPSPILRIWCGQRSCSGSHSKKKAWRKVGFAEITSPEKVAEPHQGLCKLLRFWRAAQRLTLLAFAWDQPEGKFPYLFSLRPASQECLAFSFSVSLPSVYRANLWTRVVQTIRDDFPTYSIFIVSSC